MRYSLTITDFFNKVATVHAAFLQTSAGEKQTSVITREVERCSNSGIKILSLCELRG